MSTTGSTWRERPSNPFIDVIDVDMLDDGGEEHEEAPQPETSKSMSDAQKLTNCLRMEIMPLTLILVLGSPVSRLETD